MRSSLARRVGVAALAVVAVLVVAAFALTRPAGEGSPSAGGSPSAEGDGISVSAPLPRAVEGDAGQPAPGSDGRRGPDGGSSESGSPDGSPSPTATSGSGAAGILQMPDLRVRLQAMIAQAGANPTFSYRAAVSARDAGEYVLAAELFDSVAARSTPLAPFAELRAAQMRALAGEPDADTEVAGRFAALLSAGGAAEQLPAAVRVVALQEGATALEAAGRESEALAALEQVNALGGSSARASALAERARLTESLGLPGWQELAVAAMQVEPGSSGARQALDLLDASGEGYPGLVAALVAYRGFRNDDALARYENLLDAGILDAAEAGQAWFYVGALRERFWDADGAIEAYQASLDADPAGAWADDARYWRGRVLEELARPEDAVTEYDLLVADYPGSSFAEDARLRAAVALGLAGRGADSTARLAEITRTASPATAAEAAHWHGVLVALFDAPPGDLAPASAYDPTSYAAAFNAGGSAVVGPLPASANAEVPQAVEDDRTPIDQWIASALGAEPTGAPSALRDPDVELAWLLADAGEPGVARGLLNAEVASRRGEPYELVSLAHEAKRHGLYDVAMYAANVLLRQVSPVDVLDAPRELLALAYPTPYLRESVAAAEEFGIPVLLLYALMRQESAFDPTAGSSAGAFGLTQVIYPTGEAIARDLEVVGWSFDDLASPDLSTRFGAYYLAVQLEHFEGHMLAALSAYNGGPGNAARWLESQAFPGPDGYLYTVDFTETRAYLEHVSANYAMYRYIYAGAPIPRLPHGE